MQRSWRSSRRRDTTLALVGIVSALRALRLTPRCRAAVVGERRALADGCAVCARATESSAPHPSMPLTARLPARAAVVRTDVHAICLLLYVRPSEAPRHAMTEVEVSTRGRRVRWG